MNRPATNWPKNGPQVQSEYASLTTQLSEKPHNPEAWRRYIQVAEDSGDLEKIGAAYDLLLRQYPNNATAQIQYITHFTNKQAVDKVGELFNKFLVQSPCVELWAFYLTYMEQVIAAVPSDRNTMRDAYELALNYVGQDKDSGQIWRKYIQFLQAGKAATIWDLQQKLDSVREVYRRAIKIPLNNVEQLWQELEAFETGLNKITAKQFISDLSPAHMQARTVLRQLINHLTPLYPSNSPDLYLPSLPTFDTSQRVLVGKWKAYIKWEESNPLEIDEKMLVARIQGIYSKAVIYMRYYTEIWFMAYTWTNGVGKHDEAMSIMKAGLEANPSSFLLTFAYAEALEKKKDVAEVHATYEKFLGILRANLEYLDASITSGNAPFSSSGSGLFVKLNGSGVIPTNITAYAASVNTQASNKKSPSVPTELQKRHRTEYGLAWIMYMRFGMRAEGVIASRTIFAKARKDRHTPWEIYEAAALLEYHCSNDSGVASRIFEMGLDTFGDEIEYVVLYLSFLISIKDRNNARALFERAISTFPPERARPLWERWAHYEYQYGDLEAALKLEKRMAEVYASDPPIKRLALRHMYLGTDAIAERDLGFANVRRREIGSSNSLSGSETKLPLTGSQTNNNTPSHGKQPFSPVDRRIKRNDEQECEYVVGDKRARPLSPASGPDRERDRKWKTSSPRRRSSPAQASNWERADSRAGRPRGREPPPAQREKNRDDQDLWQGQAVLPPLVSNLIGDLPSPSSFDGPVFRTDDLMNIFRNAVILSTSST